MEFGAEFNKDSFSQCKPFRLFFKCRVSIVQMYFLTIEIKTTNINRNTNTRVIGDNVPSSAYKEQ